MRQIGYSVWHFRRNVAPPYTHSPHRKINHRGKELPIDHFIFFTKLFSFQIGQYGYQKFCLLIGNQLKILIFFGTLIDLFEEKCFLFYFVENKSDLHSSLYLFGFISVGCWRNISSKMPHTVSNLPHFLRCPFLRAHLCW